MIRYPKLIGLAIALAALIIGGALAGCGGGGGNTVISGAPTAVPFTSGTVFVADPSKNQIVLFAPSPGPNSVPANPLAGSNTQLNSPQSMAFDGNHNMYVSNSAASGSSILGFTVGTYQNNSAPALTISGSNTQLGVISGIAVDSSLNIYVSNCSNTSVNCSTGTSSILIFPNKTGNTAPTAVITGMGLSGPRGLGFDSAGNLWVANSGNASVTAYATPLTSPGLKFQIQGASTGLQTPADVIIDAQQNIYVSDSTANAIFIFGNAASGNAIPLRAIQGSNTQLSAPSGMALSGVDGTLYVANTKNFLLFAPISGGPVGSAGANVAPEAAINNTLGSASDVELSI